MTYFPGWFVTPTQYSNDKQAVVIGGGLAGSSMAYSLAKRHWQVTLIERDSRLAAGASGNPRAVFSPKLSTDQRAPAQFFLQAYLYALGQINHELVGYYDGLECYHQSGVIQLAYDEKQVDWQRALLEKTNLATGFFRYISSQEASELSGQKLQFNGLYVPHGGWIDPSQLCKAYSQHENVECLLEEEAIELHWSDKSHCWSVINRQQKTIAQAPVVIIANSFDAMQFQQTSHFPLKKVRGQISYLPMSTSEKLQVVITGEGYIIPGEKQWYIGATYDEDDDSTLKAMSHLENISKVVNISPNLATFNTQIAALEGRVSFRAVTPDHLPIVGPVHHVADFLSTYQELRKNANKLIATSANVYSGLYVSVGHGSRGTSSCPLSAELIASIVCGESLPVAKDLVQVIHPSRFLLRDLRRGKI